MVHQPQKIGQVSRIDPLFVEGQDVAAAVGFEIIVAVLDPLGDALVAGQHTDIVGGQEGRQILVANLGVNRHAPPRPETDFPPVIPPRPAGINGALPDPLGRERACPVAARNLKSRQPGAFEAPVERDRTREDGA